MQTKLKKMWTGAVLLLAVGIGLVGQADAQVSGATVTGTVTDPSGAVIPNAEVSTTNTATGITTSAPTDSAGFFTIPNLIPGPYRVKIRAAGFQTEILSGIVLTVGEQQVLNGSLRLGQTSQTVEVRTEQPSIDLASSAISENVDEKEVVELPLNGRDWTLLAALQPGVSSLTSIQDPISSGYNRGNRGYGTQMSINGGRPGQNNYRIDGISANDYVNGGPGGVLGSTLGVDAISEFSVISTNYSAEYGRTSGGVVNAISRSGTNSFHGDAYEFLRNSAMDAATIVDDNNNVPKPPFRQNQFGAAAGGPIQKDHTFFFADYEGVRQSLGITTDDTVPSQNARSGILNYSSPASFPTGCVQTSTPNQCQLTVSPLVAPFLGFYPLPNAGILAPGNTGLFAALIQQVTNENFVTGRIDHRFSEKDSVFGSYQYDKGTLKAPDALENVLLGNTTERQLVSIEETHDFTSQLVNNVRLGYSRAVALNNYGLSAINPLADELSMGAVPGSDNPSITVSGLTEVTTGLNDSSYYFYHYNSFQGYDDVFLTKGKHAIKFGGGVERIQLNSIALSQAGGAFTYGSLASFLANRGAGASFSGLVPSAVGERGFRSTVVGAYIEDDIRWRPNLTFNLGMRYEMSTVPNLTNGEDATLLTPSSALPSSGVLVAGSAGVINTLFKNPTLHNFEPRVGFAWDPFRDEKTSVRAGFGLYDVLPLPYEVLSTEGTTAPFYKSLTLNPIPNDSFPTNAFLDAGVTPLLRTSYVEQNPKRNYVMQWNLNVQREIVPNLTAMIAYIGSRGVHMPYQGTDENIVLPTALTPRGYEWPCSNFTASGLCTDPGTGTKLNPNVGQSGTVRWDESSFYDALELQLTKKLSRGLEVQGSYTWGRCLDQGSSGYAGDAFTNGIKGSFTWFDPRLEYGPCDFNITQKLVVNGTWLMPTPRMLPNIAQTVLGGWQVGGIFTANTGTPFSLELGGDPLGTKSSNVWEFPDYLAGSGCRSPVNPGNYANYIKTQCFAFPNPSTLFGNSARNSLTGPGLVNLDFSLFKNNYIRKISETFNAQFRVEVFNSLNHPNLASPTDHNEPFNAVGDPVAGFGLLDITATPAREIQLALKLIW
jgi:hypothetical protein